MEYDKYTNITRVKILLLKYGVKFEPINIFKKIPNINEYKTKRLSLKIVNKDYSVFNGEEDNNIIASEIILSHEKNSCISKLRYDVNSPITLKVIDGNIILEYNNKRLNLNVDLVKKESLLTKKIPQNILNNNSTIGDYIQLIGIDRIGILFFDGCYNWIVGKPCKFCNLPHSDEFHKFIPNLNKLRENNFKIKEWWKSYKNEYLIGLEYSLKEFLANGNLKHYHIAFMSGNLSNSEEIWEIAEEVLIYLQNSIDFENYDCYLNIAPHDKIERLKTIQKTGIKQVQYNLEVVNEQTFQDACPNKMNFSQYIDKLKEAVTIFGKGNVRSNVVFGLNTLNETIDFAKKLAKEGIVCDYTVFQPKKGTQYENKSAPDFDEVLKFSEELALIYKENEFKPIFCELSSRSCVINEIYREIR